MGEEAETAVDAAATARWLGEAFGVPAKLMRAEPVAAPAAPVSNGPVSSGVMPGVALSNARLSNAELSND